MNKSLLLLLIATILSSSAFARNDVLDYSIAEVMEMEHAKTALGNQVRFYFGDQPYGETSATYGEFRTNLKTNAFNKSDKEACQWVFLSTLLSLRDRAIEVGANAVVNIKSNYKNNLTVSDTTFRCGAGALIAGVALIGTGVTISE